MSNLLVLLAISTVTVTPRPTDPFNPETWIFYQNSNSRVLALPPTGLRNFQISQSYHEIGVLFSALLRANGTANWPTHVQWDSDPCKTWSLLLPTISSPLGVMVGVVFDSWLGLCLTPGWGCVLLYREVIASAW